MHNITYGNLTSSIVAVLAFKAVYTMELTRRENDSRIRSLYVEMKEMIAVLIQCVFISLADD